MGLFLKSNGFYYAELTINGKRVQKSLRTKSKVFARDLYHVLLREQILQSFFPDSTLSIPTKDINPEVKPKTDSFLVCYDNYLKHCSSKGLSKRSIEPKIRLLALLKEHNLHSFDKISPKSIDSFWDDMQKRYKPDSIRKYSANLKAFFHYIIKQGLYTEVELHRLHFPIVKTNVRDKIFTDELWQQILKLVKHDKDFTLYLKTLYYTMSRPSEIVSLHRNDIDDQGVVRVFQNKVNKYKYMSVPPDLLDELIKHKDYIFRGYGRQPEFYGKKFRKVRLKLGLSTEYSLYTIRHTSATNLLNKTSDIHLTSLALGHSNITITAKHYANRTSKDIQDRVSILWDNDKRSSK